VLILAFYFAWVEPSETTFDAEEHARNDESVYSFVLSHREGEAAILVAELENPNVGLLSTGRAQWAWLSYDPGSGAIPLCFGRLVGIPQDISGRLVTLEFKALPADFDAQKRALAADLRVAPYWDPAWIDPTLLDDPDVALEARPARYHVDRVTHEVTASDIISGEGVTHSFGVSDITADSIAIEFVQRPANRAIVTGEVRWQNEAKGTIDISTQLRAAFAAAGSSQGSGFITSYTGEGLSRDWPTEGQRLGAGWSYGPVTLERVDGRQVKQYTFPIKTNQPVYAYFPLWTFKVTQNVVYEVSRSYTERVSFSFGADVQPLVADASSEDVIEIGLQTSSINEPVDAGGLSPMRDLRWRSYFTTDRGKQSIEYLICLARAQLLARARAVHVSFEPGFDDVTGISLRDNATITAPSSALPGGEASGKVIGYTLALDGDQGARTASVTIGCTIGRGGSVSTIAGDGVYAEPGYMEDGYQQTTGGATAIAGDISYESFDGAAINDDGVDLSNLTAANSILTLEVVDGETAQETVLSARTFEDIDDAINDLNNAHTQVAISLLPLTGGPFETEIDLTVSDLVIPQTIDLEAGA
jgi:hypothetical protein